ncbi:MAG: tyrosine-protein phosphatase [Luteibaculaceae bacterium]
MGFFTDIFTKKSKLTPLDYSVLGCDVHSHLIPGIDDGAKTLADSMELLSNFNHFGYKKVITTPHIMSDYYKNNPVNIGAGKVLVKNEIELTQGLEMQFEAAAEYYLDGDFYEKIEKEPLLTFGDKHLLFEMPFVSEPNMLADAIFKLQTMGYKPILAHPERYSFWHRTKNKYEEMLDKGVILQLNITSLSGTYGPAVKATAEWLIEEKMIGLLGSDCHHVGHIRLMEEVRTNPHLHKVINQGELLNFTL